MKDYEILKKNYGEEFARFCRSNFPGYIDSNGKFADLIMSKFEPSKMLYEDLKNSSMDFVFVDYIYSFLPKDQGYYTDFQENNMTPEELFDLAGYTLYKCETNNDVQSFKKYYKSNEELCTFRDPDRIYECIIFFAVKKDVENIKREDFEFPARDDEYGTSVISVQFHNGFTNYISIKNRYNHTVKNADATFNNNLERIHRGLTKSFEKYYGLNFKIPEKEDFYLDGYTIANDGKFYKYNYKCFNKCYCPNNIIIDENGNVERLDKDKVELIDYFIIDKQTKEIELYDKKITDYFPKSVGKIKKIETKKLDNNERLIKIFSINGQITELVVNKNNCVVEYKNETIENIGYRFFANSKFIKNIDTPQLKTIGREFCIGNLELEQLNLPNVESIGETFLSYNEKLSKILLPKVKFIGDSFCPSNEHLKELDLPNVEEVGGYFLGYNRCLEKINMPKVKIIGKEFCYNNTALKQLSLPNIKKIGAYFLDSNEKINFIDIPKEVVKDVIISNHIRKTIKVTGVKKFGRSIVKIIIPSLKNLNRNNKEQENEENLNL